LGHGQKKPPGKVQVKTKTWVRGDEKRKGGGGFRKGEEEKRAVFSVQSKKPVDLGRGKKFEGEGPEGPGEGGYGP